MIINFEVGVEVILSQVFEHCLHLGGGVVFGLVQFGKVKISNTILASFFASDLIYLPFCGSMLIKVSQGG